MTADVVNIGQVAGDYELNLLLNESAVVSKTVTLAGGERKTVSFDIMIEEYGIYHIEINDLSGMTISQPAVPAGYKGFADWENSYFIAYPEDWERTYAPNVLVVFIDPTYENVSINFNIGSEPITVLITAVEYVEATVPLLEEMLQNFKHISTEDLLINGVPAAQAIFSWTIAEIDVKVQQVYLIKDYNVFVITFTSLAETFDDYTDMFDVITNSFVFLP